VRVRIHSCVCDNAFVRVRERKSLCERERKKGRERWRKRGEKEREMEAERGSE